MGGQEQEQVAGLDYEALAESTEQFREAMSALVAGLVRDGFTDEQARALIAGAFARNYRKEDEE